MTRRIIDTVMVSGLIAFSFVSGGCAVHEDTYYRNRAAIESLRAPPSLKGTHNFKGVAIEFSDIGDWRTLSEKEEFFAAYKQPLVPLYTSSIVVMVLHPPKTKYSNDQEFVSDAKQAVTIDRNKEVERLDLQMEAGQGKWKSCLKYYKKFLTEDRKTAPNRKLFQEEAGYICQHPLKDGLFVRIDYSERYPADTDVVQFTERANQVMRKVDFE